MPYLPEIPGQATFGVRGYWYVKFPLPAASSSLPTIDEYGRSSSSPAIQ